MLPLPGREHGLPDYVIRVRSIGAPAANRESFTMAPTAMYSLYLECDPSEVDMLVAELHARGTLGVMELGTGLRAWFADVDGLNDLIEQYDGEVIPEGEEDWVQRTRDSFPPLEVGERFWLVPPWNADPPPPGRMRLEVNPGLACGTGWHACTQMCIEGLEKYLRPGDRMLDVGTGSGILIAAARELGAGPCAGCDIDPDSVTIARDRVAACVFTGSAAAARSEAFDVVVANISAPAIEALWDDLKRVCRAGGTVIVSGFQNPPDLQGVIDEFSRDGWRCLVCRM